MTAADALLAALDAAADDSARAVLIAATPKATQEQLGAIIAHRQMLAVGAAHTAALREFQRAIDAATDDDARRALIAATDPQLMAGWVWSRTASIEAQERRYLMVSGACRNDP
jgi:hypothetical protein